MASNSKKTKAIRQNKSKSNKVNLKANLKRIKKNAEILRKLTSDEKK